MQTWVTSLLSNYSTATVYCQVNEAGTSNQSLYEITSYGAYSGGDWFSFGLSLLGGTATYSVGNTFSIGLIRSGANGASASGASQSLAQTLAIGNTSGTYSILFGSGTIGTPSVSFSGDTDTGLYRSGSNNFRATAGGVAAMAFVNVAGVGIAASLDKLWIQDGINSTPGLAFENDTDTGIYRVTTNEIGIAAGGATSSLFTANGIRTPDGTAALPAYSFYSDTNTGLYLGAADALVVSTGGLSSASFTSNGIKTANGTLALPAHSFFNDTDTGLYLATTNTIAVVAGGATSAVFNSGGIDAIDGSSAAPSISFINDTDTGIYRPLSNEVTIITGGATSASFTTQGLEINGNVGSTNSATNPSLYFDGATDTGIFYSFQHPTTNRLAISAGGATAAIFTPTTTIISSLATTPGSAVRTVTVDGNGNLSATTSTAAKSYGRAYQVGTASSVTPNNNIRYAGLGFTFSVNNNNSAIKADLFFSYLISSNTDIANIHINYGSASIPTRGQLFNSAAGIIMATVSTVATGTSNTPRGTSIGTIIPGLSTGVTYWLDVAAFVTSGATMSFRTINISYLEI